MAGEKCTRKFWSEVKNWSGKTGTICRSGGKKRARRQTMYGGMEEMEINRDRTVVEDNGNIVKRYVWSTAIATYNRMNDTLTLRDGGYQTSLTKRRLNQVISKLGKTIRQKDYEWYINGERWRTPYIIDYVSGKI